MKYKHFIIILSILLFFFVNIGKSQELDPAETGKALVQLAFQKSYNIKAGIGYQSFLVTENNLSFVNKLNFTPNAFVYYISFTSSDRWMESNTFFNTEIQLGKRMYSATPQYSDTVNLLNCTSFNYYYLSVPFQLSFRNHIGRNAYWAINPGIYFDLNMGDLKDEIHNGSLSKNLVISSNLDNQDMKAFDFGLNTSAEIGFRAGYIGLTYRLGLRNLAPKTQNNLTIRNNGIVNLYIGYRFATAIGKADANKVKNVIPK